MFHSNSLTVLEIMKIKNDTPAHVQGKCLMHMQTIECVSVCW